MAQFMRKDIFDHWSAGQGFIQDISDHYIDVLSSSFLNIIISAERMGDAHEFWTKDRKRISHIELDDGQLDHLKTCAHLTYWLRRSTPIIGIKPNTASMARLTVGNEGVEEITSEQGFLSNYANEYMAIDIGFKICAMYESRRIDKRLSKQQVSAYIPNKKFIHDFCHLLKEKNVSPHSIYIIYYALFDGLI